MRITQNTKALLALAFVSISWGTTYLASKEGVMVMPALQLAGLRQFLAGVLYLSFFITRKTPWPKGKQWITILLLSFLNFFLSNGMSTWGVKFISTGLGAIIAAIFPLWLVMLLALEGKKIPPKAVIGLVLGFAGICVIFFEHLKDFVNPDFRFGIILSFAATISWAFATIITKKHSENFNPYFSLGFQMLISGFALLLIVFTTGNSISITQIPVQGWSALTYLVIIGNVCTFAAFIYTLKHLPTTLASVYAYINPIVAVILGTFLLNEKMTIFIAIGGVITILGVYMVNYSLRKKRIQDLI